MRNLRNEVKADDEADEVGDWIYETDKIYRERERERLSTNFE
jgi:hypothetical protein